MSTEPSTQSRAPSVLLVDDEPALLLTLRLVLKGHGFEVHTADSAKAARERLNRMDVDVDVVVADQCMPGETGVSLLTWLRGARPDIIRILLTGYADLAALQGAINEAGIWHFARKPWANAELVSLLQRAAESRWQTRKLTATRRQFRTLLETAPVAVLSATLTGEITICNDALRQIVGDDTQSVNTLLAPGEWSTLLRDLQTDRLVLQRPLEIAGVPTLANASLVHDEYGGWAIQLVLVDQRPLLDATRALNRAQGLTTVRQITAGVVHDFKNHLTVVHGLAESLQASMPSGDERACAEDIMWSARSASELAQQLLDLTRTADTPAQNTALNRVVDILARMLRRTIRSDIRITVTAEPDLPLVELSPAGLHHALLNLALNGRDAMPEGGCLTLSTGVQDEWVWVAVADDGTGMTPELQTRIFDDFVTTKPPGVGTGLGLGMVRRFTESAGGVLELESRPGQGTRFLLRFPARPRPTKALSLDGQRIQLLAQGQHAVVLRSMLEDLGSTVLTTSDTTTPPDVVLLSSEGNEPLDTSQGAPVIALGAPFADTPRWIPLPCSRAELSEAIHTALQSAPKALA